jgi:hypothetical protein
MEFSEILKRKKEYYGKTEAAYEFAAEEYADYKVAQALQLLQPDVIKSVCSDENLQCTDYKTACEKCLNAFYDYKKQTVL